jgi:hypothetical protein
MGWAGSIDNSLTVREVSANLLTKVNFMPYVLWTATAFTDITHRTLTFTKRWANTDLWVTYDESIGWYQRSGGDAGDFRLTLDGTARSANKIYSQSGYGYYMMPFGIVWWIPSIATGLHTVRIQALIYTGSASNIALGWPDGDSQNALAVRFIRVSISFFSSLRVEIDANILKVELPVLACCLGGGAATWQLGGRLWLLRPAWLVDLIRQYSRARCLTYQAEPHLPDPRHVYGHHWLVCRDSWYRLYLPLRCGLDPNPRVLVVCL